MISRALGPEFGGAIGTLFFFANAIGSAFNGAGLVEAFLNNFGKSSWCFEAFSFLEFFFYNNFKYGFLEHPDGGFPETRVFKFLYGTVLNVLTLTICLLGANLFSMAVSFIFLVGVFIFIFPFILN